MTPLFDNIMKLGLLKNNVFALYISRDTNSNQNTKSRLWLGGVNEDYVKLLPKKDSIIYHPVVKKTYWTLKLDQILINGVDTGLCTKNFESFEQHCGIIMDSGTSTMSVPKNSFAEFNDA